MDIVAEVIAMPFDVVSYVLARRAVTKHTHIRADITDLLPIRRADLEYPTENVSFAHLAVIDKVGGGSLPWSIAVVTKDKFTDKATFSVVQVNDYPVLIARYNHLDAFYYNYLAPLNPTYDHQVGKRVNGEQPNLATEAVDIDAVKGQGLLISCSGSVVKSMRWDTRGFLDPLDLPAPTALISATDTDFLSGNFGYMFLRQVSDYGAVSELTAYLLPAMTRLPSAKRIIKVEVEVDTGDNTVKPALKRELVEIEKLTNVPEFLKQEAKRYKLLKNKGFTDEEIKALLGYIPQHQVDIAAVTWGVFDHKPKHNTMLIIVTGDNPYVRGAIEKQAEHARSKNLRVLRPPRDYSETKEQYRQLKKEFPEWVAGKDNYAYQTLGHEVFELFQVADTYHGNIVEGIKPNAYRNVPDWEMRRTLNTWKKRLERVNVLTEERDKHIKKIEKVLKLGW